MVLRIGHRGAPAYEPENTLRSFQKALQLGADMIECDVHLCRTGELVVIHDTSVRRTTNGRGRISGLSQKELATLDAGKGEHVPTLAEVIELVNKKIPINIELKSDNSGKAVALLLTQYIAKGWNPEHFIVSSFMYRELRIFVSHMPSVRVGILGEVVRKKMLSVADALHAYSLHLHYPHITREVVENLHARGYQVFVWTVDGPEDIARMKQMGVDGIYSNAIDRI